MHPALIGRSDEPAFQKAADERTGLFDTTSVHAGIIVLALVGAFINTGLKYLEADVLRWRGAL